MFIYLLPFSFRYHIYLIFKYPHCTKEKAKAQRGQITFKVYFQLVLGGPGILLGWPDNKSLYHSAAKGMVEGYRIFLSYISYKNMKDSSLLGLQLSFLGKREFKE